MPRAWRPVKARVRRVGVRPASAARCAGAVPASGQRMKAVPICAACAPAHRTAATAPPEAIAPEATSGRSVCAPTSCSSASRP